MTRTRPALVPLLLALGCGAQQEAPPPTFSVTFTAESDPGVPLEGVLVKANGNEIGQSDEDGLIQTMLRGPEGAGVQITYECPEGHRQPEEAKTLRLNRFASLDPSARTGLSMKLSCLPNERQAAFVVRTNGHADLPILINGQEVARTNEAGVAHIIRDAAPQSVFRLKIDTSGNERMRPQDPYTQFQLGDRDDVFVFAQDFEVEEPPRRRRRRRRRPRPRPIRITRIN